MFTVVVTPYCSDEVQAFAITSKKLLVVLWTFHKKSDGYSFFLVLLIASKDYVTIAIWGFPGLLALVTRRKANLQSVHIQTSN